MNKRECRNFHIGVIVFLAFFAANTLLTHSIANAQSEEEMMVLQMYFKEDELVVTPTRTRKPLSQVAENISVISESDIKKMNAHTLTDVLFTVTGVQTDIRGGVGSEASALIEGSDFRHVLVKIDGVTQNNLSDNITDISAIPVQHIARIEIIKGPASSSWGSSLGGIINIITKSPDNSRKGGGSLSAALGERGTGDTRVETSGRIGDIGYYLSANHLTSDGLRPHTDFDEDNVYTKLIWNMTSQTAATVTFGYNEGSRGRGQDPSVDILLDNEFEYFFSTLSLDHSINNNADINVSLRTSKKNADFSFNSMSTGDELARDTFDDKETGVTAQVLWTSDMHNVVMGAEYDNGKLHSDNVQNGFQRLDEWAVYANDTISVSDLSLTPGVRYDHTNTNDDFISPSVGLTYTLSDKTVLRAYVSRGFSIPPLSFTFATGFFSVPNPDLDVEKVWSYQTGIESTALKYLRVKSTLFRHDISDAIVNEAQPDGTFKAVNEEKHRRQGVEVEIKTVPFHNTSLFAGFIFVDAKNRSTGDRLTEVPRYTYDTGIQYDDNKSLNALFKGRYTWWNAQSDLSAQYSDFIWDLNISKKIFEKENSRGDVFLTVHNVFNGSQYLIDLFKNPQRWIEGGVRLNF